MRHRYLALALCISVSITHDISIGWYNTIFSGFNSLNLMAYIIQIAIALFSTMDNIYFKAFTVCRLQTAWLICFCHFVWNCTWRKRNVHHALLYVVLCLDYYFPVGVAIYVWHSCWILCSHWILLWTFQIQQIFSCLIIT